MSLVRMLLSPFLEHCSRASLELPSKDTALATGSDARARSPRKESIILRLVRTVLADCDFPPTACSKELATRATDVTFTTRAVREPCRGAWLERFLERR
mmetsp:Transcript_9189/g.33701  ORF Transcript_9189/g.33701 Transcript_9189/m.33701 type:complete len:99 (+) Transcript_9189:3864-4160(+)